MATPERTQKEISARYQGDVDYYRKPNPWRVARFCATFLAIVGGIAGIFIYDKLIAQKRVSENFFSPGQISRSHAMLPEGCAGCHGRSAATGHELTPAKFHSELRERFHRGIDFSLIDRNCQDCHEGKPPFKPKPGFVVPRDYKLHEPNVVNDRTCSICHQEHLGPGRMEKVADVHCASCHNDRAIMEASAKKGETLPPAAFHLRPHPPRQIVFEMPRPKQGYTQVFASFVEGHPEFQLMREKARDPDVLRFNHQRHFAADIPPVNGKKLDCNYCHKPEPGGRFYERINFAANCQACHALQFDVRNPDLRIPHGDAALVRNFLRTLPAQYGDYARLKKGQTRDSDIQNFVVQQVRQLQEQFRSGEELERAVFFTTDPYKPQRQAPAAVRANFAGCAFCHEVKAGAGGAPVVTKPILVDRWMPQTNFNHAKHSSVKCDDCHHASQSRETPEVLMPVKADCAVCHSPKGKAVSECITCHTYHAPPQVVAADVHADGRGAFKEMLLGSNR